jgi:hypothetical protein
MTSVGSFVAGGDAAQLVRGTVHRPVSVEDAVMSGEIDREKVEGVWVYHRPQEDLEQALTVVDTVAKRLLGDWFLVPLPILTTSTARAAARYGVSAPVVGPLLKRLVRRGRLVGLGLLTQAGYQPYLAVCTGEDEPRVAAVVVGVEGLLSGCRRVGWRDVPEPTRLVRTKAWKTTLLRHCEFLGTGSLQDGTLVRWGEL